MRTTSKANTTNASHNASRPMKSKGASKTSTPTALASNAPVPQISIAVSSTPLSPTFSEQVINTIMPPSATASIRRVHSLQPRPRLNLDDLSRLANRYAAATLLEAEATSDSSKQPQVQVQGLCRSDSASSLAYLSDRGTSDDLAGFDPSTTSTDPKPTSDSTPRVPLSPATTQLSPSGRGQNPARTRTPNRIRRIPTPTKSVISLLEHLDKVDAEMAKECSRIQTAINHLKLDIQAYKDSDSDKQTQFVLHITPASPAVSNWSY